MANRLKDSRRSPLVAASGLALALNVGAARAQSGDWRIGGNGGVFFGYRFGHPRQSGRFSFGVEGRGVVVDNRYGGCDGEREDFAGLVGRIELLGWRDARLSLGPVAGFSNGLWGVSGEATAGVALGNDAGVIGQVGVEGTAGLIFNARTAYSFGRDWLVAGGLHFPPIITSAFCVTGRPLRRGDGERASVAGAWSFGDERNRRSSADGKCASDTWTRRACLEWASVPAFCELARQLEVCGAPAELVTRARAAAQDELRHAALSAEIAAAIGQPYGLSLDPPVVKERAPATGRDGLVRLAVESFVDGCLGEGTAAAIAAREADLAGSPPIAGALRTIAADERRHADLGWAIVEWAAAASPADIGPALRRATDVTRSASHAAPADQADHALGRWGILAGKEAATLRRGQESDCQARLDGLTSRF